MLCERESDRQKQKREREGERKKETEKERRRKRETEADRQRQGKAELDEELCKERGREKGKREIWQKGHTRKGVSRENEKQDMDRGKCIKR